MVAFRRLRPERVGRLLLARVPIGRELGALAKVRIAQQRHREEGAEVITHAVAREDDERHVGVVSLLEAPARGEVVAACWKCAEWSRLIDSRDNLHGRCLRAARVCQAGGRGERNPLAQQDSRAEALRPIRKLD